MEHDTETHAALPGSGPVAAGLRWYAAYVRSRHEFRVRDQLAAAGVEQFLPTVEKLRHWKDRKKLVAFPLFSGYLFVRLSGTKDSFLQVLKTPGVVRLLSTRPGPPEPVPETQVESLRALVAGGRDLEPYPYLHTGQRVRIKWGPLKGIEGMLAERRGRHMLVVQIDILQQGASVRIDAADVEPA